MKKYIRIIITFALVSAMVIITVSSTAASHLKGDTDCNGEIEIVDATRIQRVLTGILSDDDGSIRRYGDIDGNGLSIMDATLIQYYIAQFKNEYHIGETFEYEVPTEAIVENGKITIENNTFDVSKIPEQLVINDSSAVNKSIILYQSGNIAPEDITIQVNNGKYDYVTDYSDSRFKENYLFTEEGKQVIGYDCLVRNNKGEEVAWVSAHYESGMKYPFRASFYGLKSDKHSFPIDFYYKDVLLKRCTVTVDLQENSSTIKNTLDEVRKIERVCWKDSMSKKEKLKELSIYIANNYSYSQVICNTGAEYVAFAARDLGSTSMLLYPVENKDLITYNLYYDTTIPGGHCACLVDFGNHTLRYDVQGGNYQIKEYKSKSAVQSFDHTAP